MVEVNGEEYDVLSPVHQYIKDVQSGERIAGRAEILAVERHLADLKRESPYYFNEDLAVEALSFFPTMLTHGMGKWDGRPFLLESWQGFCIYNIFGWRKKEDDTRRFRKAYLSVARKNGKTTLAAGCCLLVLYNDYPVDARGELYCTATKIEQAEILWRMARTMVQSSSWLMGQTDMRARSLINNEYGSFLQPLGGKAHGFSPSLVCMDELHEWSMGEHKKFYDALTTGGAAREQPLQLIITTAGDTGCDMWCEEDDYATSCIEAVRENRVVDDRYFVYIARLDADDDPLDESTWIKANPNLGVSVSLEYLQDQANEASHRPEQRNSFIRFHCNRRTGSREQAIIPEAWDLGNGPLPDLPIGDGGEFYIGLDLGRNYDWSAVGLLYVYGEGDERRFYLKQHSFTCREGRMNLEREPFRSWVRDGYLTVFEGNSCDFGEIDFFIRRWIRKYNPLSIAFDPTGAKEMASRISTDTGLDLYEFFQTHRNYNEPVRRFIKEIADGKVFHGDDPCLKWQALNLSIKRNPADQFMPDKGVSQDHKIDAIVALIMAFGEALFSEHEVYDYYNDNPLEMV